MLKKISLSDQAYRELVKQIISGKLPGGMRLTEERLCREFGISRTPVRDALKKLAGENMIETLSGGGFQVCAIDAASIAELFDCRANIELLALSTAIHRIPPGELASLLATLRQPGSEAEQQQNSLECDEAMHDLIALHCGNRHLTQILRQLIARTAAFRHYRNYDQSPAELTAEREQLILAIQSGDLPTASQRLSAHIRAAIILVK